MNSRERVKNIIIKKSIDKIPYSFDLTSVVAAKIAGHLGVQTFEVHSAIGDNLLYMGVGHPRGFTPVTGDESRRTDEFGVVWDTGSAVQNIGDWGGIVSTPLHIPSLAGYAFPDGAAPGRFDAMNTKELDASERYVILGMDGVFDRGWHIRGFENLLMDFANEEVFVNELFDKSLDFNLGVISQIPDCIDGIRFGEDWGQQCGMLMGPVLWRKYLKPRLKIMYAAAKRHRFDVFIHTCGDIHEIFSDLIEIGVDVVNPIQPEVMDVEMLKREYGRNIVLYGGMGCQSTIPNGTVQDVLDEAKKRLDILGRDGGYIFGPAGAIPTDARIENVMALVDFVMNDYHV